jgi:L-2-hydroxyglutarate oxidase
MNCVGAAANQTRHGRSSLVPPGNKAGSRDNQSLPALYTQQVIAAIACGVVKDYRDAKYSKIKFLVNHVAHGACKKADDMKSVDVAIIGGGIIGLATAYNLAKVHPHRKIVILEKEQGIACHQTGRNSNVLHSGIYYKPGSLKAVTCRAGIAAMREFCDEQGVDYRICGKVIVAIDEHEAARLGGIYERGKANGIDCEIIGRRRLAELEPHAAGVKAIHVRDTGIVDYRQVCQRLAADIECRGHEILTGAQVLGLRQASTEVIVKSSSGDFSAQYVINCAGLHSDRVTSMAGGIPPAKIVPFRGEYFKLKPEAERLCKSLIYPVPDPRFPFLGVHFTRMVSGGVECGPNAVLAFAREGYSKTDVNFRDLLETLAYRGFRRFAAKHWRAAVGEMRRAFSKSAFVTALQRLVPEITPDDLVAIPAGVRAQAISPDGAMVDDFSFDERPRIINVVNAPSPAATASLSIGKLIVERLARQF